jgi:hypothetical protein
VVCLAALCFAVSLGLAFAYARRGTLTRQEHAFPPSGLWYVLGFSALFFSPTVSHLVANNLAWSLSYWVDPVYLPPIVMVAWYAGLAAVPVCGFLVGAWTLRQAQGPLFLTLFVGGLLSAAACITVGYPRLAVVGSYHKFHHGFGLAPLSGSDVGMTLLWAVLLHVVVAAWTYQRLNTLDSATFGVSVSTSRNAHKRNS